MRKIIAASLLFVIAGTLTPLRAHADNAELLARIEKLESELKILKRQIEIKTEDEDKKKAEAPIVTASSKEGFSIKSQDENFKLKVRGYVQADGRFFTDNKKDTGTTDVFTARRVRPIIEGTLFRDYDFHVLPSFDSGTAALQDAYIEYKYYPAAKVKAGKFKPPFGLERLQSITNISFIKIRSIPKNLCNPIKG
jgi:phosphate-selective porin OprO/OprP